MWKKIQNWWGVGTINPERDEAKMPVLLLWVERAAIMVVAIVSGIAVAVFGYTKAADYTDWEIIRWLSAGVMFFLATAITDVGVKYFIQKAAYDLFAVFNPATYKNSTYTGFQRFMQIIAWFCMVAIIAGLFLFDYVSVNSVRDPVANMVKKEEKLDQKKIRSDIDKQEASRGKATVAAITAIESDINSMQRQIEKEKTRVLNSNSKMKDLSNSGNGWAKQQIASQQAKAIAPLNKSLDELYETKKSLNKQRAKDLEYRLDIVAKTDNEVLSENEAINKRNTSLVEGTSNLFIYMGFWAKCIAGLIRILLVVLFMGSNVKDYNGDGRVDYQDVSAAAEQGFV